MPAFIVEDGSTVASATSYLTVAEADDYLSLNSSNTEWTALLDADKERQLMWATHMLDALVKWDSYKCTSDQALAWPRAYAVDKEGFAISTTEVPEAVKQATAFLANQLLTEDDPTTIDESEHIKKLAVDVIAITFRDGVTARRISAYIQSLLKGLGRITEPGALGFAPIQKV